MRKFKLKNLGRRSVALCAISVLFSCVKGDDPLITYEGKVFIYVGPFISNLGNNVDESDLSPGSGITMQLYRPGACGFGHCASGIKLDEQAITDAEGNYSFIMRSTENNYYATAEFPGNIEYSSSRGSRQELENKVVFADIILVDNQ